MKASLVLVILFAFLGCEKKVLSDEERARNAVTEWVAKHYPSWSRFIHSAEKTQKAIGGVLVIIETREVRSSSPNSGTIGTYSSFFVRSDSGTLEVEHGWGSPENEAIYKELIGRDPTPASK